MHSSTIDHRQSLYFPVCPPSPPNCQYLALPHSTKRDIANYCPEPVLCFRSRASTLEWAGEKKKKSDGAMTRCSIQASDNTKESTSRCLPYIGDLWLGVKLIHQRRVTLEWTNSWKRRQTRTASPRHAALHETSCLSEPSWAN